MSRRADLSTHIDALQKGNDFLRGNFKVGTMSALFDRVKNISIKHAEKIRLALEHGEKVKNCECSETVPMLSRACDYCRNEQVKDFNYVENVLDMCSD